MAQFGPWPMDGWRLAVGGKRLICAVRKVRYPPPGGSVHFRTASLRPRSVARIAGFGRFRCGFRCAKSSGAALRRVAVLKHRNSETLGATESRQLSSLSALLVSRDEVAIDPDSDSDFEGFRCAKSGRRFGAMGWRSRRHPSSLCELRRDKPRPYLCEIGATDW